MSGSNYGFAGAVPPGVSVEQNIAAALEYQRGHSAAETMEWFYQHVRNNKDERVMPHSESMDYKQRDPIYADFGNYNFGAVAAALGISEVVAVCGAGWAQGMANGNGFAVSAALSALDILGSCGDNPEDTVQIMAGHAAGSSFSISTTIIQDAVLDYIADAIMPGYVLELPMIAAFLDNEVAASRNEEYMTTVNTGHGSFDQITRDKDGGLVEVAAFTLNGPGWDVVVYDGSGYVVDSYFQYNDGTSESQTPDDWDTVVYTESTVGWGDGVWYIHYTDYNSYGYILARYSEELSGQSAPSPEFDEPNSLSVAAQIVEEADGEPKKSDLVSPDSIDVNRSGADNLVQAMASFGRPATAAVAGASGEVPNIGMFQYAVQV